MFAALHANADSIALNSTGAVNDNGSDPNWTVYSSGVQTGGPVAATVGNALPWLYFPVPQGSQWDTDQGGFVPNLYNATIDYYTTFNLTDANDSTVAISGNYAVDNSLVDVLLNGHSLGITDSGGADEGGNAGFFSLTSFTIGAGGVSAAGDFLNGTNTLTFVTFNGSNPQGLLVQFTSGAYSQAAQVPANANTAYLLAVGITALLLARPLSRRTALAAGH